MSDKLHLEKWHAEKNHWRENDKDLLKTRVHKGLRGQRSIFSMFFEKPLQIVFFYGIVSVDSCTHFEVNRNAQNFPNVTFM